MSITYNGVTRSYSEWAEITGVPRSTIGARIQRGWSIEEALSTEGRTKKEDVVWMEVSTDKYALPQAIASTQAELADMCGIRRDSLTRRLSLQKAGKVKEKYIKVVIDDE